MGKQQRKKSSAPGIHIARKAGGPHLDQLARSLYVRALMEGSASVSCGQVLAALMADMRDTVRPRRSQGRR